MDCEVIKEYSDGSMIVKGEDGRKYLIPNKACVISDKTVYRDVYFGNHKMGGNPTPMTRKQAEETFNIKLVD